MTAAIAASPLVIADDAMAQIVHWANANIVVPNNIDGRYINVETRITGSSGASVPGWDINPYSATSLTWFNATGTGMARFPGVTTGSAGNLALGTAINATRSFGSGAVVVGSAPGNWQLNAANYFGFRFVAADGQTRYGWGKFQIGASISGADRTIVELAYNNTPGATINVGDTGGGSGPYDPCATTNPTATIGTNPLGYESATATDLTTSCGTIFKANYYKFTPPISGSYTISTCSSSLATRLAVLSACNSSATSLGCNDNSCGSSSSVTVDLTAATPVFVVVGGEAASPALPITVSVTIVAPTDPICVSATAAAYGDNAFNNTSSTSAQASRSNASGTTTATINKAVWYSFTPTATGQFSMSLCGVTSSLNDTMLAIGTSCPTLGGRFEAIAFSDDSRCAGAASAKSCIDANNCGADPAGVYFGFPLTQDLVAGTTYYICAGSFSSTANISGLLNISGPEAPSNPNDLNGDGIVDALDLAVLLAAWGTSGVPSDINQDGIVDALDLASVLSGWTF